MPFLASCPFCPAKLKLSRKKVGASVQCEQCGNHFTAVPPDEFATGPSAYRQLSASSPAPVLAPAPLPSHTEATTEPSLDADSVNHAAMHTPVPESPPAAAIPDWINLWGFAGFFLTSMALFFATSGLLRSLSIPLAIAGLVICLAGVPFTPRKKARDFAWFGLTSVLNLAFLLVAFVWPHHLNRFWGMDQSVKSVDPAMQFLASRNNQVQRGRDLDGQAWVEADKHAVRQGDIHVRVEDVKIELDQSKEMPTPKHTSITVRVSNMGQLHRFTYRSPVLAGQPPILRDNRGKAYMLRSAGANQSVRTLKPLAHVLDQWNCEPVDVHVEHLDLEVPASAWASKGSCKFRIPRSMIVFPAKE